MSVKGRAQTPGRARALGEPERRRRRLSHPEVRWSSWQVEAQPRGHVVGGGDGAAEHAVDVRGDVGWIGTARAVLGGEAQDGRRLAFVAVGEFGEGHLAFGGVLGHRCSRPGRTGPATHHGDHRHAMARRARPVSGSLSYWRTAHTVTRTIDGEPGPGQPISRGTRVRLVTGGCVAPDWRRCERYGPPQTRAQRNGCCALRLIGGILCGTARPALWCMCVCHVSYI